MGRPSELIAVAQIDEDTVIAGGMRIHGYCWQSTATAKARQTSCMRVSLRRPRRSTSTPIDTLSTESRLTADRLGTGSSSGSRMTSLASVRIVVVHGATSARRSRGIAASRESTTTGRLPICGSSHHHSSPRAGAWLTKPMRPAGTTRDHPRRQARRADAGHRRRMWHRSRWRDAWQVTPPTPRLRAQRRSYLIAAA